MKEAVEVWNPARAISRFYHEKHYPSFENTLGNTSGLLSLAKTSKFIHYILGFYFLSHNPAKIQSSRHPQLVALIIICTSIPVFRVFSCPCPICAPYGKVTGSHFTRKKMEAQRRLTDLLDYYIEVKSQGQDETASGS